ncbi:hypothetical protein TrLO_g6755 [Triparma laevis f. longispina]|uniref:Uncharacterized protein n=1 Tax=Triparma laevis f. longispina TaxID=1714387 RepID=A0A9W7FDT6_9STRA|nr:hypothetical protein TrLO_g6755 [Triparma laevis f. longispina]
MKNVIGFNRRSRPYPTTRRHEWAFAGCSSLETVVLKEGEKTIEDGAFHKSSKISTFIWADSIEEVGEDIFQDCTKLHELARSEYQEAVIGYLSGNDLIRVFKLLLRQNVNDWDARLSAHNTRVWERIAIIYGIEFTLGTDEVGRPHEMGTNHKCLNRKNKVAL